MILNATIVQTYGTTRKTYGPFTVTPGPDFDECGLDTNQLSAITRQVHDQGAQVGYCDVIYKDDKGKVVSEEIAII